VGVTCVVPRGAVTDFFAHGAPMEDVSVFARVPFFWFFGRVG